MLEMARSAACSTGAEQRQREVPAAGLILGLTHLRRKYAFDADPPFEEKTNLNESAKTFFAWINYR